MKQLFTLLVIYSLVSVNCQPTLYSVVTEFGGQLTETVVWTGKIDLTTGAITKVVENFIYVGGSGTYDGISDLDDNNGIYYFANDFATPFVYSSDLGKQLLRPTIDTGAKSVLRIHHDDVNNRLLVLQVPSNGGAGQLVQVPTTLDGGKAAIAATLPTDTSYEEILVSAFDDSTQKFYVLSGNTTNPGGSYYLSQSVLNTQSPVFTSVPVGASCPSGISHKAFPQYIAYDSSKSQIVAAFEVYVNNNLQYYVYTIGLDGSCSYRQIPLQTFGIATAWTFDSNSRSLFFALAPNGSPQVYVLNVDSMALSKPIIVDYVPTSLQISRKF